MAISLHPHNNKSQNHLEKEDFSPSSSSRSTRSSVCWYPYRWFSSSSSSSSSFRSSSSSSIFPNFIFLLATTILISFAASSSAAPTRTSPLLLHTPTPAPAPAPPPLIYDTATLFFTGQQQQQQGLGRRHNKSNNKYSSTTRHLHHRNLIIAVTVSSLFLISCFLLILITMVSCFNFFRKTSQRIENNNDEDTGFPNNNKSPFPDRPLQFDNHDMSMKQNYKNKFDNPCFSTAKRFTWDEVQRLTMNFTSRVIGEGGFSTLYLTHFSDSSLGALKIHSNSERLNRIFKQELEVLLQIRHENIVQFLGYCDERDEGALVFEFVPNGSLHEKLHEQKTSSTTAKAGGDSDDCELVLPWKRRMRIAFQLAKAIEYLHDKCAHQIIHGDIKSSNVLLDQELNCKLCDFGFSKMGFSSTVMPSAMSPLMGSPGYMDPNYLRTGIASKKNDVYSFGVILLELITGMEAFCPEKQKLLTTIAAPAICKLSGTDAINSNNNNNNDINIAEMMDPRLDGCYDTEEAMAMASISSMCLRQQPGMRPSMADILRIMTDRIPSVNNCAEDSIMFSAMK